MTYDDTARKLAVKVIGTVESGLDYTAVNYNDPITVGIAQWYGTRAASVLCRMRDENPSTWTGVAGSLDSQLRSISSSDTFWNSRYLTQVEGSSLIGPMGANHAVQESQLADDLEPYKQTAIEYGFNPDSNTKTVIYFFCMHHQSPKSALEVVRTLDSECTLEQIHAATLVHPVLGIYSDRYNTAYQMISTGDTGGTDPGGVGPGDTEPAPGTGTSDNKIAHISFMGDVIRVYYKDKHQQQFLPNGRGYWLPGKDTKPAVDVPTDPEPTDPDNPPVITPGTGKWTHPLPGATLTSPWGERGWDGVGNYHYGFDLSTGTGSSGRPVLAPTDLVITQATDNGGSGGSAGTMVKGHTLDGKYTFSFFHMVQGSLKVRVGDTIGVGTPMGIEGATGNVTGLHCHIEIYPGIINDPWPPPYGPMTLDPYPIFQANGVVI